MFVLLRLAYFPQRTVLRGHCAETDVSEKHLTFMFSFRRKLWGCVSMCASVGWRVGTSELGDPSPLYKRFLGLTGETHGARLIPRGLGVWMLAFYHRRGSAAPSPCGLGRHSAVSGQKQMRVHALRLLFWRPVRR